MEYNQGQEGAYANFVQAHWPCNSIAHDAQGIVTDRIDFTYLSTQFISMVVKRQDGEWVDRGYTGKYQDVVG